MKINPTKSPLCFDVVNGLGETVFSGSWTMCSEFIKSDGVLTAAGFPVTLARKLGV